MKGHRVGLSLSVLAIALLAGCAPEQYQIAVVPSLQPVDTARARVVFSQAKGEACGPDAVAGALKELDRFVDAHGFVEVVMEGTGDGDERCVRVFAKPFRYGTSTESLTMRAGDPPTDPLVIPGRHAPPEPDFCDTQCRRVTDMLGAGSVGTEMEYQRCLSRCNQPDAAFRACIEGASTPVEAQACMDGGEEGPGAGDGEPSVADPSEDEEPQ